MVSMVEDQSATLPLRRLSGFGQLYVTTVGAVAVLSLFADSHAWYVVLVILALPLSLVALWVGFYAGLAVGFAVGADPAALSWPVALVWVAVWTMTAWVNAQLGQKVLRHGWAAVPPRPRELDDDD
jgi:hypothetical protein